MHKHSTRLHVAGICPPMARRRGALCASWVVTVVLGTSHASRDAPGGAWEAPSHPQNGLEVVGPAPWAPDAAASVRVHGAGELRGTSGWVNVTVAGVASPRATDWVGMWVGSKPEPVLRAPAKYKAVARESPEYLQTGEATLSFHVTNFRAPVSFALLRGGVEGAMAVASSPPVAFPEPNAPAGGHLALLADHKGVLVQWTTRDAKRPLVRWGTAPGSYDSSAPAETTTFKRTDMCGGVARGRGWTDPGLLHAAPITGIAPGEIVYYVYGDDALGVMSAEASFIAPPAPGSPVSIIAIADMGYHEVDGSNWPWDMIGAKNVTALLAKEAREGGATLLHHVGDIAYARGCATIWDTFFENFAPVATRLPYMVGIGNHERIWRWSGGKFTRWLNEDSGGECGVPFERRLRMPTAAPDEPWYAYTHGAVHFVQISTEHDFAPGSKQHDFVRAALAAFDRKVTPWLVFMGHRPIYIDSSNWEEQTGDMTVGVELQDAFEALWLQYGVDLTLTGHHHSYQRSCPVVGGSKNATCVPMRPDGSAAAPVHLVIGNAGAQYCHNIVRPGPAWMVVVRDDVHGYARITADATTLRVEAVDASTGLVYDELALRRPKPERLA